MNHYERNLQKKIEIEDGMLQLLEHVPFSQISVTRLSDHLDISRKCFYHYFPNREACLESLIDRMIVDAAIHVTTAEAGPKDHLHPYMRNLQYWKQRGAFLNMIAQNGLDSVLISRYLKHQMSEDRNVHARMQAEEVPVDEDVLYFLTSSIVGLLLRWCRRGFDTPVEEMARKFHRLLRMPLLRMEY